MSPYPERGISFVEVQDYQQAYRSSGFELRQLCGAGEPYWSDVAWQVYVASELRQGAFFDIIGWEYDEVVEDMHRSFGLAPCDVLGEIDGAVGVAVPSAVYGEFDPAMVASAARADDRWSDRLTVTEDGDVFKLEWSGPGSDLSLILDGPEMSPMYMPAQPRATTVSPSTIVYGRLQDDPEAPRISEVGTLYVTAEALVARNAEWIVMSDQPYVNRTDGPMMLDGVPFVPRQSLSEADTSERDIGLPPWSSVGVGTANSDDTLTGFVVVNHETTTDAIASMARFEAILEQGVVWVPNTDWAEMRIVDITTEGTMMIATIESAGEPWQVKSVLLASLLNRSGLVGIGD